MLKAILLIPLLSFALSKDTQLEYGVKTKFSPSNNNFKFSYNGEEDVLLVYIEYNGLDLEYEHKENSNYILQMTINTPGEGFFVFASNGLNEITLNYEEATNKNGGTIWINPLKNILNVDLSKKYSKNIFLLQEVYFEEREVSPLTYAINNASKTVQFKFEFEKTIKVPYEGTFEVSNPFIVCHEQECQNKVTSFEFQKGESYLIKINIQNVTNTKDENIYYAIPKFSFADINYEDSKLLKFNFWIIVLLYFLFLG